jgi:biotin carboxyl carrier protein
MAIAGCFLETNQSSLRQQWMMTLASQAIEKWLQQTELQRTAQHAKAIGDALALCGVLDRTSSTTEAATCLVNHLRRMLSATQVVFCEGKSAQQGKLIAISEVEQFDVHSESSKVILAAAAQGIGKEDPVALTASTRPDPAVAIPLEAYCKANRFASCITIGVTDHDGSPTGSLLIASDCETFSDPQLAQLKQFATVNGAHLEVIRRANLGLVESVIDRVKSVPRKKWFRNALIAIGIAFAILCVPTPYRVHCDCEIQPAIRRFVAVPYTGPLEKTLVEPGEVVSKGQILARMDGQQLRHELTGVKAEFNGAKRRRDSALAQGEVAQSQIARSEMNQLESRLDSLRDQLSRLEIRSPYDGIVISGDLQKAEGASMEIGQTLFEVAPLENMLAEVAIPESEIQYVSDSNSVAIKLNAFPFQTFTGKIRTVHPSAEVINDDSVFVAEVDLSDVDVPIRPGMKGAAKVNTSWRPLGWNLFHNAWESVRCWTVW